MAEKKKPNPKQSTVKTEEINALYGKKPPQAVDLEAAVLGALMIEKDAVLEVLDLLKGESFYHDAHRKIYEAIVHLSVALKPIDMLTVTEELRKNGKLEEVGGAFFISQLTSRVASATHIKFHARIVAQKYIQRELIRVSSEIQYRAYDESMDVEDLLDFSEKELFNISTGNIKKEMSRIDDVLKEAILQMEEASKREDGLSGVPCGFTGLDRVTSGWQRSDMIVIAARPSMGKTAFVLSMMRNIAVDYNQSVALFSLEMSSVQLVNRLIVGETGIGSDKIKTGRLSHEEWKQFEAKIKNLSAAPLYIDDTPGISIFELRAKARRLKMLYDVQLIVIDYLQLMSGGGDSQSREQEVSMISRGLKGIAKELNIPIIALSQLNRAVEMRAGDKRPQVSDLRESGAIEQDADIIIFIHRPERFGITEDEQGNSTKGKAEIIIAKHRNGEVCDVPMRFIAEQAKFVDEGYSELEPLPSFNSGGGAQAGAAPQMKTFQSKMNSGTPTAPPTYDFNPNQAKGDIEVPF